MNSTWHDGAVHAAGGNGTATGRQLVPQTAGMPAGVAEGDGAPGGGGNVEGAGDLLELRFPAT
eukprot:2718577-Lingulodinium_polyedra.AAC.1